MKGESFILRTLLALLLMFGIVPLLMGCDPTEDPVDIPSGNSDNPNNPDVPDIPTGNYVQYQGVNYTTTTSIKTIKNK